MTAINRPFTEKFNSESQEEFNAWADTVSKSAYWMSPGNFLIFWFALTRHRTMWVSIL